MGNNQNFQKNISKVVIDRLILSNYFYIFFNRRKLSIILNTIIQFRLNGMHGETKMTMINT